MEYTELWFHKWYIRILSFQWNTLDSCFWTNGKQRFLPTHWLKHKARFHSSFLLARYLENKRWCQFIFTLTFHIVVFVIKIIEALDYYFSMQKRVLLHKMFIIDLNDMSHQKLFSQLTKNYSLNSLIDQKLWKCW